MLRRLRDIHGHDTDRAVSVVTAGGFMDVGMIIFAAYGWRDIRDDQGGLAAAVRQGSAAGATEVAICRRCQRGRRLRSTS